MTNTNQEISTQPQEEKLAMSQRFTNKVLSEFTGNIAGELQITTHQRALIQGYFIGIDRALSVAEENRLRKNKSNGNHEYDNPLPCAWTNINLNDLALDVVHYARMGLDMMQDNHLSPIPFRNKKTGKYDITLMPGYNGIQYIAEKYAVEKPKAVTVELVYSFDIFKPIKKSLNNPIESYEFEIIDAFNRGQVKGGFGYIQYDDPAKNKLVTMSLHDIEKRKPEYASAEFWGGKAKKWEGKKQVEVETDGWFEEMCLKTVKREVYSAKHIPRDPQKIDDNYQYMKMRETKYAEMEVQKEIDASANQIIIDTTIEGPAIDVDFETGEIIPDPPAADEAPAVEKLFDETPDF